MAAEAADPRPSTHEPGDKLARDDDNRRDADKQGNDDGRGENNRRDEGDRQDDDDDDDDDRRDENAPLLPQQGQPQDSSRQAWWHRIPRSCALAVLGSLRWILLTLAAPGIWLIACLYDDGGAFSPLYPIRRLFRPRAMRDQQKNHGTFEAGSTIPQPLQESKKQKTLRASDDISPSRRSIRIKLSQDALAQRDGRRSPSAASKSSRNSSVHSIASSTDLPPPPTTKQTDETTTDHSVQLKSPTSPAIALTRYPKTPAPPRPLVPRRQPSYLNIEPSKKHQKTLILDLDETLIHSMSKGGRMSTGHMVEVRLTTTYVGHGGQTTIGPQHPILYWVNKRPHCDDFLRRVCKWYNLVIFTASVPEYADPVIDWLEQERKFFSGRYYRQHCTFRQGAFIKDLSSVEPDLSRVMILDNSPLSYMFHQDNAIPIQGWINDPTDNDLLHLVPLLEGLQYVSDVRALLALRGGEDGQMG